jgi:hypothetical protein
MGRSLAGCDEVLSFATPSDLAGVAVINKLLPRSQAAWAMEAPLADDWAGDEQRPTMPVGEFNATRRLGSAKLDCARPILFADVYSALGDGVLGVAAIKQDLWLPHP